MDISDFENNVLKGLYKCGVKPGAGIKIGAAVSGGADSISLLYSLARILRNNSGIYSCNSGIEAEGGFHDCDCNETGAESGSFCGSGDSAALEVITVNHYMRPEAETCGDVSFVVSCCENLRKQGFNVNCTVVELAPGSVCETARVRQAGSEEAARFLRYKAFDSFIDEKNLDFLCLAHNKNDNYETILMRFLQGSSVEACGGIQCRRGSFIRPLLLISRDEIEEYLTLLGCSWCNDKTNEDTNYFRNNIRHNLIPFLDEKFSGWKKAVAAGAEKAYEDGEIIKKAVDSFKLCHDGDNEVISFYRDDFIRELPGVQKRVLIKACNLAGESGRISNDFLNDVIHSVSICQEPQFLKIYGNIEINVKKDLVFVKKYIKKDTDLVFFDIIEEDGSFDFPFGPVDVTFSDSYVSVYINGCQAVFKGSYPICIRNAQLGDEILSGSGKMKKVADIYSDWHVADSDKKMIPMISCCENGRDNIKCILAAFLGYKDWIVK